MSHKSFCFFKFIFFHGLWSTSSPAGVSNVPCSLHPGPLPLSMPGFYFPLRFQVNLECHLLTALLWTARSVSHLPDPFYHPLFYGVHGTQIQNPICFCLLTPARKEVSWWRQVTNSSTVFPKRTHLVNTCWEWGLDPAADKPRLQGDSSSVAGEVLLSEGEPPSLPLASFSNIWFGGYRVNLIRQLVKSSCGGRKLSKICRGTLVMQTQGCRNSCSREQERRQTEGLRLERKITSQDNSKGSLSCWESGSPASSSSLHSPQYPSSSGHRRVLKVCDSNSLVWNTSLCDLEF